MPILNTRNLLSAALSCAMLSFPGLAIADSEGLFLGAAVNYGQIDDDFNDNSDGNDFEAIFDDKSVGYNLGIGWRFNKWLSIDAGYWDFGEFRSDDVALGDKIDIETTTFTAGAMLSVPLWILDVYARGGAAFWDADADRIGDDGTDPYYGVGAALNIFGSLDLYLEVMRFDLNTDLDTANLGLRFTF